ncbi:MAG: GNAT family N-acetyltransferase, partial [Candidatus Thorarchaeota archaeon]|nr:GNAT family N-acetyltransferase [Candidatus Thorarchaeota archaeon]
AYSFIDLPSEQSGIIDHSLSIGYREMTHSLWMERDLNGNFVSDPNLRFEKIEREEADNYLSRLKEFMSGSPDEMLEIIFGNLTKLPSQFIDHWFTTEHLYYVYDKSNLVGILDLSTQYLNLANIGVSQNHRRKGYGRRIMNFGLKTLKEQGKEHSALRVDSVNTAAVQLYESLGFAKGKERVALIWRK